MGAVIPSILVASRREIEDDLKLLQGHAGLVQLDIVDGKLAHPPTWPYAEGGLAALPKGFDVHEMGDIRYQIDLMTTEPGKAMRAFLAAGAAEFVFHLECGEDIASLLDELERTYGRDKDFAPEILSVGISARIDTPLSALEACLPRVDYVQFMGIADIGRQGIPFDERVIGKIREFKKLHPGVPVQVDGGVSLMSAPKLIAAGAERLVVGSALWKSDDVLGTLAMFEELLSEHAR